eukprot:11057266-Karenia_brevis.AAC.1
MCIRDSASTVQLVVDGGRTSTQVAHSACVDGGRTSTQVAHSVNWRNEIMPPSSVGATDKSYQFCGVCRALASRI